MNLAIQLVVLLSTVDVGNALAFTRNASVYSSKKYRHGLTHLKMWSCGNLDPNLLVPCTE